jgi:hypothetical protein
VKAAIAEGEKYADLSVAKNPITGTTAIPGIADLGAHLEETLNKSIS